MNSEQFDPTPEVDEAIDEVLDLADQAILQERRRRELIAEPHLRKMQARLQLAAEEHDNKKRQLEAGSQNQEISVRWVKLLYWAGMIALFIVGMVLAHFALSPYINGCISWLLGICLAALTTFATHLVLESSFNKVLVGVLAWTAFICGIVGIVALAVIRGEVFALLLNNSVSQDGGASIQSAQQFYSHTIMWLRAFMGASALGAEMISGILLHRLIDEAKQRAPIGEARRQLAAAHERLEEGIQQAVALKNAGAAYEAEAKRDLCLARLRRFSNKTIVRKAGCVLITLLLSSGLCWASDATVALLDCTRSVSVNTEGNTNFQSNVAAIEQLITTLPADSRFIVIAITDRSFADPKILVDRIIPAGAGDLALIDRTIIARQQIGREFKQAVTNIRPDANQTDIIGALEIAGQYLRSSSMGRKSIYMFSDLRQATPDLNVESVNDIPTTVLDNIQKKHGLPDLHGVDIHAIGVDGHGKSLEYWFKLKSFWMEFFKRSGGVLRSYSATRDLVALHEAK